MKHDITAWDIPRSEWEALIDEWIFSERDRDLLKRRLLDGITFERLAEEFDLSTRHVKTIIYKQGQKLFAHIHSSNK